MAGPTVGRAEIKVDFDGNDLVRQADRLAQQAGKKAGFGFTDEFNRGMSPLAQKLSRQMEKAGKLGSQTLMQSIRGNIKRDLNGFQDDLAKAFSNQKNFRQFIEGAGSVEEALKQMNQALDRSIERNPRMRKDYEALRASSLEWATALTKERDDLDAAADARARLTARSREMDKVLREVNTTLSNQRGFNEITRAGGDADGAIQRLNTDLINLHREGKIGDAQYITSAARLRELAAGANEAASSHDRVSASIDRSGNSSRRAIANVDGLKGAWRRMDGTVKLVIISILAAGAEISVLGSVAGSSLAVLGGALVGVGIGIGTLVAAFKGATEEGSALQLANQGAYDSLNALGGAFGTLKDAIQVAALSTLGPTFDSLKTTVEALTPAFQLVASTLGTVISQMAAGLAPGTDGFNQLNQIILNAVPIIQIFGQILSNIGGILGSIFIAAQPSILMFLQSLETMTAQFSAFLASAEGQTALADFFNTLQTVMPAIVTLVGALGTTLASMVTPATIASLVGFLTSLAEFVPVLGEVLMLAGDLGVMEILATILDTLGQVLTPLLPAFSELASVIGEGVLSVMTALTPVLVSLAETLAPLITTIAELAGTFLEALVPALQPVFDAIVQILPELTPLFDIFGSLTPIITILAEVLGTVLTAAAQTILAILPSLVSIFTSVWSVIEPLLPLIVQLIEIGMLPLQVAINLVVPIIAGLAQIIAEATRVSMLLIKPIADVAGQLSGPMADAAKLSKDTMEDWGSAITGFIDGVVDAIQGAIGWFQSLFGAASDAEGKASSASKARGKGSDSGMASGGVVTYGARRLIGEDGPEAVVPLDRSLSNVDPSVRWLSAIAQGMNSPMANGGVSGGRNVQVMPGAIVVQTAASNGSIIGAKVLDQLVQKL